MLPEIFISDYNYSLPPGRIAEFPLSSRDQSKLLIYQQGKITDEHFFQLPAHIPEGSTLLINNTRVIEARLIFKKQTGGAIEIFCLEPYELSIEQALQQRGAVRWKCLIGGASKWKHGQVLEMRIAGQETTAVLRAHYIEKLSESFVIEFQWEPAATPFIDVLHAAGHIPLPPYIKRQATESDKSSYQTIFSKQEGSVAAPTAALHFTEQTFEALAKKNIKVEQLTLHVGAGTFKPVKTATVAEHEMHAEPFSLTKKALQSLAEATTLVAVGTTSLRTVESVYWIGIKLMKGLLNEEWTLQQWEAYELMEKFQDISRQDCLQFLLKWMDAHKQEAIHCRTSLIIQPGYQFQVASGLVTNFHQPQSTLLLLVSALIGDDWKKVYQHALDNGYRFLSYGDSSLLWKTDINRQDARTQ